MTTSTRDDLLSSQVRRRIVDFVREHPGSLAAADLGGLLDLHVTTVRFHLDQLEQAGVLVAERERREKVGRPRKVYTVAPDTVPVNESAYVVLVEVLSEALSGDAAERAQASVRAGESWARRHVSEFGTDPAGERSAPLPIRELVDVLARWGYRRETVTVEQPEPGCHRMSLLHCPMKEAAIAHPEVVCAAHLGLIRGTLERLGVPDPQVKLTPFLSDELCVAVLSDEEVTRGGLLGGMTIEVRTSATSDANGCGHRVLTGAATAAGSPPGQRRCPSSK